MSEIRSYYQTRQSVRQFSEQEISRELLEEITSLALRSPSSINGQQTSLVIVTKQEDLDEISKLCWGQEHIKKAKCFIFIVADFYRTSIACELGKKDQVIHDDIESILVAGVDAGIMAQSLSTICASYGIGTTLIGAIRGNAKAIASLLHLPERTFPVVGMVLGYPGSDVNSDDLRPRFSEEHIIFWDEYREQLVYPGVVNYEDKIKAWWAQKELGDHRTYVESVSGFYSQHYAPTLLEDLQSQGFLTNYQDNNNN